MYKKFSDIKSGDIFQDDRDNTFIKLQDELPSGRRVTYASFLVLDIDAGYEKNDYRHAIIGEKTNPLYYNAVSLKNGIPACCLPWKQFKMVNRFKHVLTKGKLND